MEILYIILAFILGAVLAYFILKSSSVSRKSYEELQQNFITQMTKNVALFTVRNAELDKLDKFYKDKKVLLEQISKKTFQMVTM